MPEASGRLRRVIVTGEDEHGASIVTAEALSHRLEPKVAPGWMFERLWAGTVPACVGHVGLDHVDLPFYPRAGELRSGAFTVPPSAAVGRSTAAETYVPGEALAEAERLLPGGLAFHDPTRPGYHRTPTVDILVVLAGTVRLRLDGSHVDLGPGDVVVQRGTSHAWENPGDEPAELFYVMVGAGSEEPA